MTQEQTVLKHLKTVGSITGIEASAIYKIRSLPRRISTLKVQGHYIESIAKRDITGQRYVRYEYLGFEAPSVPSWRDRAVGVIGDLFAIPSLSH